MQEQVNDKTVALTVKGTKLTGRLLAKAMAAALRQMQKAHNSPKVGRQSIKRLNRTLGGDTSNIEVAGRIQSFERYARKHQISYHVEKDLGTNPPKWTVYFKAKQADAIMGAFSEYSKNVSNRAASKPSLLSQLNKFKELAKNVVVDRVKNKNQGGHEL